MGCYLLVEPKVAPPVATVADQIVLEQLLGYARMKSLAN